MGPHAFITGVSGTRLSESERSFLREAQPAGAILFSRNVESLAQVAALVGDLRDTAAPDPFLILIDQEGGRVQRIKPPLCPAYPPAAVFASLYATDPAKAVALAYDNARVMGDDLNRLGITVNCAPVLDCPVPGADRVIGDRAYGVAPDAIIALGRAVADGLFDSGVLPVIKHTPGHGRATADSHFKLPKVKTSLPELEETDFAPFLALCDLPIAMTAHVVYTAVDPDRPATTSKIVVDDVIRGATRFDGLLLTDDLSMKALSGPLGQRTVDAIAAGCDIALHCNGQMQEMKDVAANAPMLTGKALARFEAALGRLQPPKPFDRAETEARLAEMLAAGV
jgi:beta-N-acetylhexosaminidase